MRKILLTALIMAGMVCSCKKDNTLKNQQSQTLTINGAEYPIVVIGDRIWMAANYEDKYGTKPQIDNPGYSGRLYTISQMRALSIPDGWRIPTKDDWLALVKETGGKYWENTDNVTYIESDDDVAVALMSDKKWLHGENKIGFNAMPTEKKFVPAEDEWVEDMWWYTCRFWCSSDAFSIFDINDWSVKSEGGAYLTHHSQIPSASYEGYNIETKASIRLVRDK